MGWTRPSVQDLKRRCVEVSLLVPDAHNFRARSATSKPARAKIAYGPVSENPRFAKFRCNLAGPVSKTGVAERAPPLYSKSCSFATLTIENVVRASMGPIFSQRLATEHKHRLWRDCYITRSGFYHYLRANSTASDIDEDSKLLWQVACRIFYHVTTGKEFVLTSGQQSVLTPHGDNLKRLWCLGDCCGDLTINGR
jgi:hypothetical protein